MEKEIRAGWTWLTDYAYWLATWTLNAEDGRLVEVGMGVSFRGKPRGGSHKFRSHYVFETFGIGAIHCRVIDNLGPCRVRLDKGEVAAITIYSGPSIIDAAVKDAKRVID